MPTTMLTGQVDTSQPNSARLIVDMHEPIRLLDIDTSQFQTMLMDPRLAGEAANHYKKNWLEDRFIPRVMTLSASATSSATTLLTGASEGAYAKTGDIIRLPLTGEAVRVTSTDSVSTLTVVRGVGGVAAVSAASASGGLIIVGGSNGQGGGLPLRLVTQETNNYNYTQITRNAYGVTRTMMGTSIYGGRGNLLQYYEDKAATEHKADLENTGFFGARSYSSSSPSGHPLSTAGGLIEYISSNITNAGGTFDKGELQDWLTLSLQYGGPRKVIFAAPIVGQVMSEFLQDNWVKTGNDYRLFGSKINGVISGAFGDETPVVVKRQWGAFGTGTGKQYGSQAFCVDMDSVRLAVMENGRTKRLDNRQANDIDGVDGEFLTEQTLVVTQEQHHSLLQGVTG